MPATSRTTSVVICAYTDARFAQTIEAACSALRQQPVPLEVILVVDHNDDLLSRLAQALPEVRVIASRGPRGLSGARNTGVDAAHGELIAFLDDDASARAGWLAALEAAGSEPGAMIVGGLAVASWQAGRPAWFPPEYLWVVGCSYRGQHVGARMRNPLGCNMAIRREAFDAAGVFSTSVGRVGALPVGAEETELALRVLAALPGSRVVFANGAVVDHQVPAERGSVSYFLRRCYHEGTSKAVLSRLAASSGSGSQPAALGAERAYIRRALPRGVLSQLARLRRPAEAPAALGGATAIVAGVVAAGIGFTVRRLGMMRIAHEGEIRGGLA